MSRAEIENRLKQLMGEEVIEGSIERTDDESISPPAINEVQEDSKEDQE